MLITLLFIIIWALLICNYVAKGARFWTGWCAAFLFKNVITLIFSLIL